MSTGTTRTTTPITTNTITAVTLTTTTSAINLSTDLPCNQLDITLEQQSILPQ